ncbi:MAG: GAF domain-containing protein, partial [Planctomycetota bacterium]
MESVDPAQVSQPSDGAISMTTAEIVDRLGRFDGPPEQFLMHLLAVQCRLAATEAGVILRFDGESGAELLAVYPQLPAGSTAPVWIAHAVESSPKVLSKGATALKPLHDTEAMYGQPAKRHVIMVPILGATSVRGVAAYLVNSSDPTVLAHCRERLELSICLLSLYEMRLTLQHKQFDLRRLQTAMETLTAVNDHNRFAGAGMAACNEIASRWGCDRVSLGFLKGRYVHLKALSHTEKINRKMKLVQDIEAAMEECLDQDVEVLHPAAENATYISRSAGELSKLHGPMTVLSLPLRRAGEVVGVLTAERAPDRPFDLDEVESLRLACELSTARLASLHETDRWFGARAAGAVRKGIAQVVGPKHTWIKMLVLGIVGLVLFTVFGKGDYKADATFVLEATQQQIIPAPFEGYIEAVHVEPGDKVIGGQTVLAKLETTQLESRVIELRAQYAAALSEADKALDEQKIADHQIAMAKAEEALAQIKLLERMIDEASIRSP